MFSDDIRRNPYPLYAQMRAHSPVLRIPPPFNGWMLFDYESVKRALNDHEAFSSQVPAPKNWFIFSDPPKHTKLRNLISRAFTPRSITNLESRIAELSRELLDPLMEREEFDLAKEYAVPLPMKVLAGMIGIPLEDWEIYRHWSDVILRLSYTRNGDQEAADAMQEYLGVTAAMAVYTGKMIERRRADPQDDLLTRLIEAEVDGERLSPEEILGFLQLLLVAGQETTSNLINNAIISLTENPEQFAKLRANPDLLPSAIEEVLRYRSPLHWILRAPREDVTMHGQTIPAGALVLPVIGSANRDPKVFDGPDRFDIARDPNPHIAFGHGIHFCIGAALSRLEARVALPDLFARWESIEPASGDPWPPRRALQVHGPSSLKVRVQRKPQTAALY